MANTYPFYYQNAFKDYIKQFLRVFRGFQVEYDVDRDENGELDKKTCNIFYSDMDRIVANILHDDGHFVASSLPIISGYLTGIELNPELRHSRYHAENVSRYNNNGSLVSEQKKMGVPYTLSMDLSIFTSNSNQMFQLLEQILMLFNPKLTIQKSDNIIDWTYLTEIELVSITPEANYPISTDERYIVWTLGFVFPVWLDFPAKEQQQGIIEQIEANILDCSNDPEGILLDTFVIPEE
jgi:hypothetical protein